MLTKEELENIKIQRPDMALYQEIKKNWDAVAKPLDGMGDFEGLLARIGAINHDVSVSMDKRAVLIMCADNGIVEEHISQSGCEVTALVAASIGRGTSSVCRMAHMLGADVIPVDIGIAQTESIDGVLQKKVAYGTRNFLREPAMTEEETLAAIDTGRMLAAQCRKDGYQLLATGEMGIGNTTTSSAMAAAMLAIAPEEITGKGAGLSDEGLAHKVVVIRQALERYRFAEDETFRILSSVGGLDIAGLAGIFIGGAQYRIPVVADGVISAVAALAAERLVPGVRDYVIPSHRSREPAAGKILAELGIRPVIDAGLALGEGTGAVMMFALLDTARVVYGERTTFADIGVAQYTRK